MKILGLDLSLRSTGWATPDKASGVVAPLGEGIERLQNILCALRDLGLYEQDLVVIEGYSFASKMGGHQLGELGGVIRYSLWLERRPFIVVAPTTLKKFVGGKGNLKKDEMRLETWKRWQAEFRSEHEVDAFGLSKIGEALRRLFLKCFAFLSRLCKFCTAAFYLV